MAIFPYAALSWSDRSLPTIIVDNSSDRLICWLSKFLLVYGIPNQWVRFWLTRVPFGSEKRCEMRNKEINWGITPSTQSNLFPNLICFFYVETHKVSTSIRGGFQVLLYKIFLEQVHSARLSCTADARPLTGFEKGPNLAENRVEYVLLTTWDGNSIFYSANRARPSSQKLLLNGFTEWNFHRNKEKAYQNRE